MQRPPAPVRIEELLAHREWLLRMARALVHDDAQADDLVQDVWTSALQRPPAARGLPLRGWLATVLRFKSIDRLRAEGRRRSREESAAREERQPSAAEVVARGEVLKRVVIAVMDLEDPYRSAVLLRFFEDLPLADVAARQGVPLETARTRLRRALARLRERLDADHGGDRRAWLAALLPISGASGRGRPATATVAAAPAAAVAAGGLLLLGGWWLLARDGALHDEGATGSAGDVDPGIPAVAGGQAPSPAAGDPGSGSAGETPEPADWPRGVLRGTVVAADGRTPAAGVEVKASPGAARVPDGLRAPPTPFRPRRARTDARGRFLLEEVPAGAWTLEAAVPSLGKAREVGIAGEDPPWAVLVLKDSVAGRRMLSIRVLDEAETPVPGARVELLPGPDRNALAATADAAGRARLEVNSRWPFLLTATHRGGAAQVWVGYGHAGPTVSVPGEDYSKALHLDRDAEVPVTIRSTGALSGRLLFPSGGTPEGAVVEAWPYVSAVRGTPAEAVASTDGAYRLEGLPAGKFVLLVRHPGGLRVRSPVAVHPHSQGTYIDLPSAEVAPGGETTCDLVLEAGGNLRGRVERPDGSPVAGARVEMHLPMGNWDGQERTERVGVPLWRLDADEWGDERRPAANWVVSTTGADGIYEVRGLVPAEAWRVRVVPGPDLSFDFRGAVAVEAGKTTEILHRVVPAGTLEAMLPPSWSCALRKIGEESCRAAFLTPSASGAACIPGLPAGEWEVFTVRHVTHEELIPAGRLSIRAGELTHLDLEDIGLAAVVLRFEREGRPVAGVAVRGGLSKGERFSAADGTVRLRDWVRPDAPDAEGRATVGLSFRPPEPEAARLSWQAGVTGPDPDGEWRATVPVPTGRLVLKCVDPQGRPRAGVSVQLEEDSFPRGHAARQAGADPGGPRISESAPRRTDDRGVVAYGALPVPRCYRWTARFPDGQVQGGNVVLEDAVSGEVLVASTETASLRVTVLLPDGRPAQGATVLFVPPPEVPPAPQDGSGGGRESFGGDPVWGWDRNRSHARGVTDDDGVLVVRGVPAGTVWVSALPRGRWVNGPAELREVCEVVEVQAAPPGEASVTVRMKTGR